MPKPIKHKEMLRRFRALGWQGPFQRGVHPFVLKGDLRITIPNPHRGGEIDWSLMKRILQQADISTDDWENA
jgi:predicted RNA binding protein YcfA (HicA-like mRNA interferase family)